MGEKKKTDDILPADKYINKIIRYEDIEFPEGITDTEKAKILLQKNLPFAIERMIDIVLNSSNVKLVAPMLRSWLDKFVPSAKPSTGDGLRKMEIVFKVSTEAKKVFKDMKSLEKVDKELGILGKEQDAVDVVDIGEDVPSDLGVQGDDVQEVGGDE